MEKEIEDPFTIVILDKKDVVVENPFSGERATLTPQAVSVYDKIIGAERILNDLMILPKDIRPSDNSLIKIIDIGKAWFIHYYPEEYMILLD